MKLLIDADACPVIRPAMRIAREHQLPLLLFCDTSHVFFPDYGEVRTIGAGADAVDFALLAECAKGDIVITQDYGLAALALARGALPIHQSGRRYTEENIDGLLMDRYLNGKARRASSKSHIKGPSKRTAADDLRFAEGLEALIAEAFEGKESI